MSYAATGWLRIGCLLRVRRRQRWTKTCLPRGLEAAADPTLLARRFARAGHRSSGYTSASRSALMKEAGIAARLPHRLLPDR